MKIRYFKHETEGYYFSAFVRWDNEDDILAMCTCRCSTMLEALVFTQAFLKGWPPVMLVEPMGYTNRDLVFNEIKIPVQKVINEVFEVPVKVL